MSDEELSALEQLCDRGSLNKLFPSEVIGLSTRTLLLIQVYREKCAEVDQLCEALDMYRNGYQGACMACEPVGELNQKLDAEVRELKQQVSRFEEERDAYKRKYARLKWRGLDDE